MRCGEESLHAGSAIRCFPATHESKPSAYTHDENCSSVAEHPSETIRLCFEHATEIDPQTGTST